jgi:hypothetical protein
LRHCFAFPPGLPIARRSIPGQLKGKSAKM